RDEGFVLLGERLEIFVVGGDVVADAVVGWHRARGTDRAGDVARRGRRRARQARPLLVQLAGARSHVLAVPLVVLLELDGGRAERVRLDDLAPCVEVALVDPAHDVGMRHVPELGTVAVEESSREQHGPVAAVEHERLARAHPFDDLPPPRLHDATFAIAATSALALTTARVESLA